jgi:hypothetical protein
VGRTIGNAFTSIGEGVGGYYADQPYLNYLQSIKPVSPSQ